MKYPTILEVSTADRKQIYKWYLLLPVPGLVRDKTTKIWFWNPPDGPEIFKGIMKRWKELGGRDLKIADEIMRGER